MSTPEHSASDSPSSDEVLTVEEAAPLLRVNRKTLYAAISAGDVPSSIVLRFGRTIRLSRAGLLGWLRGNGGPALGEQQ